MEDEKTSVGSIPNRAGDEGIETPLHCPPVEAGVLTRLVTLNLRCDLGWGCT